MENGPAFIILDGVMCAAAVLAMDFFHPVFLFKQSYATLNAEKMEPELELLAESVRASRQLRNLVAHGKICLDVLDRKCMVSKRKFGDGL